MKITLVYENPEISIEDITEISGYSDSILIDGIILKLNRDKTEIDKKMDISAYNKLSVEQKFKTVIIPEFKQGKRFFVKIFEFGKISKINITDFVCDSEIEISIDEAKKLIEENPNLQTNSVKCFFEFYA